MSIAPTLRADEDTPGEKLGQYVCIASIGHSGSTLVGMLLDQHPATASMGEMTNVAIFADDATRTCGCGTPVKDCEFWQAVQDELRRQQGDPELKLATFAQRPIPRTTAFRRLPALSEILQILGRRGLWRAARSLSRRVRDESLYGERGIALYEAIAAAHHKPIVVNSTGATTYMKAIYLAAPRRFRTIHVIRDGRGWTRSLMHRTAANMEDAARLWARRRWNSDLMMASIPRRQRLLVRYEDLCTDTRATMLKLGAFLGLDMSQTEFKLQKRDFHGLGGNPMRFRYDDTQIQLDEKWRQELSADDLRTFERIGGARNRRDGYE